MGTPLPEHFDVLLIKDSEVDAWVAHALQVDVAGQGSSVSEALGEVQYAMAAAAVRLASADSSRWKIGKASSHYWHQYGNGYKVVVDVPDAPHVTAPVDVTVPTLREARVS